MSATAQPEPPAAAQSGRWSTRWHRALALLIPLLLYAGLRLVYFHDGIYWPADDKWSVHTAVSIVREGDTDLDEYADLIGEDGVRRDYTLEMVNGKIYTIYPIGASLLAVPYVAAIDHYQQLVTGEGLQEYLQDHSAGNLERLIASSLTALSMVCLYFLNKRHLNRWLALGLAVAYGLATSAWSTAAVALWQHTPTLLLLILTLWILDVARDKPERIQYAGLTLAVAFVCRPTNAVVIFGVTAYVALFYRRQLLRYLAWAAPVAIAFIAYSYPIYGRILPHYYLMRGIGNTQGFGEGLAGTLVSPNRGLFVWTPLALFAFYGVYLRLRARAFTRLDGLALTVIVAHWLLISGWAAWWGGYCMGPRFFTDMLPFYALLTIPVLAHLPKQRLVGKAVVGLLLLATVLFGVFVQSRSATTFGPARWNPYPVGIDVAPSRLWNWQDIQFLRPNDGQPEPLDGLRINAQTSFGFGDPIPGKGWSVTERAPSGASFTWMVKRNATLYIDVPRPKDIKVSFRVLNWLSDVTLDSLALYIGDAPVALTRAIDEEGAAVFEGVLPATAFGTRQRYYVLTFAIDHALSPTVKDPQSTDTRKLGLALDWIRFAELSAGD